jgi:protein MpaA
MHKRLVVILMLAGVPGLLSITGCSQPEPEPQIVTSPTQQPTITLPTQHLIAGRSAENRPIMYQVFGTGPDVVLIIATIHGDEAAGVPLARRLAQHLERQPNVFSGRTVALVPVANPDGLAYNTRHNANGVDLNRNFNTANRINDSVCGRSPLSEPEARVLEGLIRKYRPDRIVSIHQPLACIDYDGPGQSLASRMAQYCDLPIKKLGAKPGSLGSYAGVRLAIPIITLEMRQSDSYLSTDALWQRYGNALLAAIAYPENPQ